MKESTCTPPAFGGSCDQRVFIGELRAAGTADWVSGAHSRLRRKAAADLALCRAAAVRCWQPAGLFPASFSHLGNGPLSAPPHAAWTADLSCQSGGFSSSLCWEQTKALCRGSQAAVCQGTPAMALPLTAALVNPCALPGFVAGLNRGDSYFSVIIALGFIFLYLLPSRK